MVIAIDGPAGAGKSTVARALAAELGFTYLDSGAMYRCVGLLVAARRPARRRPSWRARRAIELSGADGGASAVLLDGARRHARRSARPRSPRPPRASPPTRRCARRSSPSSASCSRSGDWVAEGRDIGTVVAPDAALKVFLTADPAERARRRAVELGADAPTVLAEQTLRDERDRTREHSPLRPAPGAVVLDTTGLTIEQVVERIARARAAAIAAG